jgi:hypothetical protein
MGKKLGISQSAISKVEQGLLVMSAPEWFQFCRITEISPSSIETGVIDIPSSTHLSSDSREGSFRIPKEYSRFKGSKMRGLRPFLYQFHSVLGQKSFERFFEEKKIDTDALAALLQSYLRTGLDKELENLPRVPGACIAVDDVNERMYPMRVRPRFSWHGGGAPGLVQEKKDAFEFK